MKIRTHIDAAAFLRNTRAELESNEAANSLILGVCGRLVDHPEQNKAAPCLKTVEDADGLALAAMMTPPHKLAVYGHQGDVDGAVRILVEELLREGWKVPGAFGPGEVANRVAERWMAVTGRGYSLARRERVYQLTEVASPVPERGRLRPATEADLGLVSRWWRESSMADAGEVSEEESGRKVRFLIGEGDIYLWEDGEPVSAAMKTRPTRHGISVSFVYTPPEFRRQGYATACVGELSRTLLEAGWRFCALFADLSNETSNRVYQRIGYRPVCDYDEYAFAEGSGTAKDAAGG